MTVKTELERLKKQKEELEQKQCKIKAGREELYTEKKALYDKKAELSERTSPLAKKLQADIQQKVEEVKQRIDAKSEDFEEVMKQLQAIQEQIDARENDTALYIQEQVNQMVPTFLGWVKENKETIGYDITRRFIVAGVTSLNTDNHGRSYEYPNGVVGIFEDKPFQGQPVAIALSHDFYFSQSCYEVKYSRYKVIAEHTQWYSQYMKDFTTAFLQKLEESYNLGEDLKLTITSPEFTLELV